MESQVIEQGFQKVWQMFQETDRKFKETDRKFQETDREFQETKQMFQESDRKFDKYFGKIKEMDRNWGKLVESLVKPSVATQFRKRGIPIIGSGQRVEREIGGETMEIDILLTNGDSVVAVEVKTKLTVEHVNEHIEKHLKPFRRFFPEYQDKKVYGAVAYIHLEENSDRYAYKNGLFVLTFDAKNMVKIKNDSKFIPKTYETES